MTPAELLTVAREIQEQPSATTAGIWPRAAAILARQALEGALDELWEASPDTRRLSDCTRRSQLACLPSYLDARTARQIAYVWSALSGACHYHAYELAPTTAELVGWIDIVDQLLTSIFHSPEGNADLPRDSWSIGADDSDDRR
jgi:hypothetical protein